MAPEPKHGFPRARRITRSADIERLARSGTRVRAQLLDIRHLASATGAPRAAVVVAKFGFTAVARNTLKRRLRELVRANLLPRLSATDILVRARREAYAGSFADLKADVERAASTLAEARRP